MKQEIIRDDDTHQIIQVYNDDGTTAYKICKRKKKGEKKKEEELPGSIEEL